jgi:hypothetical protein
MRRRVLSYDPQDAAPTLIGDEDASDLQTPKSSLSSQSINGCE